MKKILLMFLISLVFLGTAYAIPRKINFQGVLKDGTGVLLTGPFLITFGIYGAATGGTAGWSETQTVSVEGGLYNVQLGSVSEISEEVFETGTKYLGIKVGSDAEMTPRVVLVSVPYAYKAGSADKIGTFEASNFAQFGFALGQGQTTGSDLAISVNAPSGIGIVGGGMTGVLGSSNSNGGAGVAGLSTSTGGYGISASNTAASGSDSGAALRVNGKIQVDGGSVGKGSDSWGAGWGGPGPGSFVTVTNSYSSINSKIFVFPISNFPLPGTQPVGHWGVVAQAGSFIVMSNAVEAIDFNYLIIN